MLAGNLQGHRRGARAASPSLLAGKIVDATGQELIPSHACKGNTRYRYYVSRDLHQGDATSGMRIPAVEIEAAVSRRVAALFDDGLALAATAWLDVAPRDVGSFVGRCADTRSTIAPRNRDLLRELVQQVCVHDGRIEITCSTTAIAAAVEVESDDGAPDTITIISDVRLTRSGRAMRLIQGDGTATSSAPNPTLIRLLLKARRWWARLRVGDVDIKTLAAIEGVQAAYITRVVRLAFLSPAVVDAILKGSVRLGVDGVALTATGAVMPSWSAQQEAMLPAKG